MDQDLNCALAVIREDIRAAKGYPVQSSPGLIKLDVMENPFRLSPALQTELGARLGAVAINRYPAERTQDLARALAEHAGLPQGCGLMLGNGSDELISLLALALARPGACILSPLPSFVLYEMVAKHQGLGFVGVPLREDFELDEAAMLAAINAHQPALIYLACPNNPTGTLWDEGAIRRIIAAAPGLVVMDEAYQPFAERDSMALLREFPKVMVMRTMSKFGLAGVRIGYLMARQSLIDEFEKIRPPFNVSVLNAEAGLFALEHAEVYAEQAAVLRSERDRLLSALRERASLHPYPSQGNMLLVRVPDAAAWFAALKQQGILVKNVSAMHPMLAHCLRITIGTPEENQALLRAVDTILSA